VRPVRISIVTPSLDQVRFVEESVRSVLDQRGDFELEHLVMDGGSTDGSLEVLRRHADRLTLHVGPDAGQADAVNQGLRRATGELLGWVNSDDRLCPGALDAVAGAFREHPEALWLHGRCPIIDEAGHPVRRWVTAYKARRARSHGLTGLLLENYVSQMTVFWRRELMDRVGLLDDSLHYAFDYDLWLRFARVAPPLFLERPLAEFRWYPTSKSGAGYRLQFAEDYRVFLRHAPASRLLRLRKRLRTAAILGAYRVISKPAGRP